MERYKVYAPERMVITLSSEDKYKWERAFARGAKLAKEGVPIEGIGMGMMGHVELNGFEAGYAKAAA